MAVTRTSAAERRKRQGFGLPSLPGMRPGRGLEALLLAGGSLAVLFGLILVYLAVTRPLADVQSGLSTGEVLNLNEVRQPEPLLPLLAFLDEPAERSFVAQQIVEFLQKHEVQNVGELGRLRVPVSEIEKSPRLPGLRARAQGTPPGAAAGTLEPAGQEATVHLLTIAQLRQLKPHFIVRSRAQFRTQLLLWGALFFVSFLGVHAFLTLRQSPGNRLLLPILLVLCGLGLMVMISVRDPLRDMLLFRTFVQGVFGGLLLFAAASQLDLESPRLRRLTFLPLGLAAILSILLITLGSGPGGSDAKVNLFGFQPVEVIKILIVVFLSSYFFDRWEFLRELTEKRAGLGALPGRLRLPKLEYMLTPMIALGVVLLFFFLQHDLGPALVLAFLFLILYSTARGKGGVMAVGVAAVVLAFFIGYKLGVPHTVSVRIQMWLSPWDNAFRGGDHLAQGLWAFAGGAFSGTGLGLGQPGRVPEVHTDLVLAAIGEELGFLGVLTVFALWTTLLGLGFRTALRARGIYSFFLILGLTLLLGLQMALIAGGVLGLLPLSGVVSPFLSSGRTAMLANFLIVGLLLAASARSGDGSATERFRGGVRWTALCLGILGLGILGKAALVQVVQPDKILTRGALTLQADGWRRYQYNPRLTEIAATIPRGSIVDRNGIPLATSDPKELERFRSTYERLGVSLAQAGPPGSRLYPFGGRTFHLLGDLRSRVNWGAPNTSYAERDSRIKLQGYDDYSAVVHVRQPAGEMSDLVQLDYTELIPLLRYRWRPEHPDVQKILKRDRTLHLALDIRLQLRAAEILQRAAQQSGFGGAAVVLDAATGDLLASVSYPWPQQLTETATAQPADNAAKALIDRARYGIYPPGSTFKLVTAMAALRHDPALATRQYECKTLPDGRIGNYVKGFGKEIRDDPTDTVPHGTVDLQKGIAVSCNAYFAQLGSYDVGPGPLLETAKLLGISVAVPNTPEQLKKELPQSSYGQGQVIATPFQMARVAATIADGGAMPQGRWVIDESNTRKTAPKPILAGPSVLVISQAMRRVVTSGTAAAYLGRMQPAIAGKTGTAEVQDKKSHSWFIGYAPYDVSGGQRGKKIALSVIIEHGGYGGRLAAPAAGEIVRTAAALGLLGAAGQ
ncbi:MAG TPA: FtsW/RodA/SpoVE family cell cycle protein [Thermoanaerobaculia bacterium]|jgi:cell division protein FtsW (lipid II flippase)|nr:FtsW/RodA/SpoVE family cell cycle protein [Thermoanaerobaculia bacterium]